MKHLKLLGAVALLSVLAACGGGGGNDCNNAFGSLANCSSAAGNAAPVVPAALVAPVAVVTGKTTALTGSTVTLNGSSSTSSNNDQLTYTYKVLASPEATLPPPVTSKDPLFNFTVAQSGTYVVSLTVSSGNLKSEPAVLTLKASDANFPPIANAGVNQNVTVSTTNLVTLDGTGSIDLNTNDKLTYEWAWVSRPEAAVAAKPPVNFDSPTSSKPKFMPSVPGDYVASLVVRDDSLTSMIAYVRVSVTEPVVSNARPVAVAGPEQFIYVAPGTAINASITLDGSASTDANNDVLNYKWKLSAPSGSTAVLSTAAPASAAKPVFVANVLGTYVATLVVNDSKVDSESVAQTRVTVSETNVAPVAVGVATPSLVLSTDTNKLVTLDGSASTDANRDKLTYRWLITSVPTGAAAVTLTVDPTNAAKASFTPATVGVYVATLIVNDGKLDSVVTTVPITYRTGP